MSSIKTFLSRSYPLLNPFKNPNKSLLNNPIHKSLFNFFSTQIPNSVSYPTKPQESLESFNENQNFRYRHKRPLDVVFKEALGLCEKKETFETFNGENGEFKRNLLNLEMEIKQLKEKNGKNGVVSNPNPNPNPNPKTFYEVKKRGRSVWLGKECKEISQDMELLLRHLYDFDYFKDEKIFGYKFDLSYFYEEFAHDYVKNALQKFGIDNMEISKWLSDSDAKTIALFGCPSLNKGDVKAAKHLRSFFKISEESVCSECVLNRAVKS